MSSEPGQRGARYLAGTRSRIKEQRSVAGAERIELTIDGALNRQLARECSEAGAVFVMGRSFFCSGKNNDEGTP